MNCPSTPERTSHLWWRHARPALILLIGTAVLLASFHVDLIIAGAFFFDASRRLWVGTGNWWVNELIHTGGRWAVRAVVALTLATWIATFFVRSLRSLRRPAGYFVSAIVLTAGVVGLLKTVTNVDCPWDLQAFGGRFPYVDLFSVRAVELRRAHCFPAAHSSSGYAFMALYFVAYERSRKLAVFGLTVGLLVGLIFGIAQQARGAHFVSHDLWSAFFAWIIPLTLYAFAFNARLYARPDCCYLRCSQVRCRASSHLATYTQLSRCARSTEGRSATCSTTCARKD